MKITLTLSIITSLFLISCNNHEQEEAARQQEFELAQSRAKQEEAAQQAAYDKLNSSISTKLISFKHKTIKNNHYLDGKESVYEAAFEVTNNADKSIRAYTSNVEFHDLVGNNSIIPIYNLEIINNIPIKPKSTINTVIISKYGDVSRRDWQAMELVTKRGIENLDIKHSNTEILFADGERLK